MVEVMGKRKKMPTTSGINIVTGIMFLSPEGDDRQQEWSAEKLRHYSIEGQHFFVDLVRPSKSIDTSDRHSKSDSNIKSKPDISKVRKWTDQTKEFPVEAQFIGLLDGKIQLRKVSGIKIAVPVSKMSVKDLDHVENVVGVDIT